MSKLTNEEIEIKNEDKEDKRNWSYLLYLILIIILLFFSVFSITYSIYKGDLDDSEITTDNIIFAYSDVDKVGNGIYLKDAIPISDKQGKLMVGSKQYFDFYVTASTKKSNIRYKLLINKDSISTLQNNNVKIYLTNTMGGHEKEIILCDFSELKTKKINGKWYYVLHEKKIKGPLDNYTDSYRLRMWIKNDAQNYENKIFSVKVDVFAEQIEE